MYIDVVQKLFPLKDEEFNKEYPIQFDRLAPIVIYPYAGWSAKEWDLKKYVELSKLLNINYNCTFIDNNLLPIPVIEELKRIGINIFKSSTINDLISILKCCSLIISNDYGPVYIANILNKPTFSIYGPTNPDYSLPYGKYHRMIQKKIHCSPGPNNQYCYTNAGLYCPHHDCLNLITIDEVYHSLINFLKELSIKRHENSDV